MAGLFNMNDCNDEVQEQDVITLNLLTELTWDYLHKITRVAYVNIPM